MNEELKKQVESVLFSAGKRMELVEIARFVRCRDLDLVLSCLKELKAEYEQKNSSLMIIQDDVFWKFTVKEDYLPLVRKIVTQTELTKSVMETLAVIAFKNPVLQSHIIKVRTNKAYDHLNELENLGYITRTKQGRTKLIKLAKKFFEYFDVPEDQLKEKFKSIAEIEQQIGEKENLLKDRKKEIAEQLEKASQQSQEEKQKREEHIQKLDKEIAALPEIDLVTDSGEKEKLEVYEANPATEIAKKPLPKLEEFSNNVDGLEVYKITREEVPKKHKKKHKKTEKHTPEIEEVKVENIEKEPVVDKTENVEEKIEEKKEIAEEKIQKKEKPRDFPGKGMFPEGLPKEIEESVEQRVKAMMKGEDSEEHGPSP